jgi:hypothetical protein
MANICDVVRLARFDDGRRWDGPHQICWTDVWDEKSDDRVGCDRRGSQEHEGRWYGTTGQVEKVGFLEKCQVKVKRHVQRAYPT